MYQNPKVLLVDDELENVRIRALLLEKFGCDTVIASNQAAALEVLRSTEVDLLLLDYHLANGRTGDELARDARAASPRLRIILLTGDPLLPDSVQTCADRVLIKGLATPYELLGTIEEMLPGVRLRASSRTRSKYAS